MIEYSPIDSLSDILMDFPDLVFAFGEDGCYLFINRAAGEFLETDPDEVIGLHWRDLGYSPEVLEPLLEQVKGVWCTDCATKYRMVTSRERGSRILDISLSPLHCDEGKLCAVLAVAHDVSEFFPGAAS